MRADRFITAVCASFLAIPAAAQDIFLDDIIVTAGEEKVAIDTPQSVSVVDIEDLSDPSVQTIGDAIGDLPGVTLIGGGSILGQSFNIRGIGSVTAADESRFIMNIDGASHYYEQYRMGSLFADPAMFKTVEVLRGPASSTLYGAGALAGVINMETFDPADFLEDGETFGGKFELGYGTDRGDGDRYSASASLAWQATPSIAFLASLSYKDGDDFVDGEGNIVGGSEYGAYTGLIKGVYEFGAGDAHSIEASWLHFNSDQHDISFAQTGFAGGVFGFLDRRNVVSDTANVTYRFSPEENPLIDLKVMFAYSERLNEQFGLTAFGPFVPDWTTSYESYQLNIENTADVSRGAWESYITAGISLASQDRVSDPAEFTQFQPEGNTDTVGVYVQGEFIYDDRLTLIPGLRIDNVTQKAGDSTGFVGEEQDYLLISPKIAALYQFNDTIGIFGSVAHTENAPVIDQLYDGGSGDPTLAAEKSDNFELGFTLQGYDLLQAQDVAKLKVTGFHNHLYDVIDRDNLGAFDNFRTADYTGLELEAGYDSELFFATAVFSMVNAELDDGSNINSIPADEWVLSVGTRIPSYDLSIGWKTRITADQSGVLPGGTDSSVIDGYVLHNIFATYAPDSGTLDGWELRAEINNLFDEQYITYLNAITGGDSSRGLSASLSISKTF